VESAVPPPQGRTPRSEGDIVVKEDDGKIRYEVPYDKLVIAVGCYSASLGIEGVSPGHSAYETC
jgi:NADPH-dependent 2,4-dienoyl-CoA reductase/sulfur reductase-like enzyme